MSERININPVSLIAQKIVETKEFYLEIHETYIHLVEKFLSDDLISENGDENLGTESVVNDCEFIILKKHITGIDKSYIQKQKAWKVSIQAMGFGYDVYTYIKSRVEAENLFNKLLNYITS